MFDADYFLRLSNQYKECLAYCKRLASECDSLRPRKAQLVNSSMVDGEFMLSRVDARLQKVSCLLLDEQERCDCLVKSMLEEISYLPDSRLADLVRLHYVDLMPWQSVGDIMCIDVRWVYRLRSKVFGAGKVVVG